MLKDTTIFLFDLLRPGLTILRLVRASPHGDLWTVGGLDIHSQVMLWTMPEVIGQGPDGEACREGKQRLIGPVAGGSSRCYQPAYLGPRTLMLLREEMGAQR
jgi:hypothetical protein